LVSNGYLSFLSFLGHESETIGILMQFWVWMPTPELPEAVTQAGPVAPNLTSLWCLWQPVHQGCTGVQLHFFMGVCSEIPVKKMDQSNS
jgi:hypothetical protein